MSRQEGTVKWFSAEKGFGFITRDDGSDVFVHHTAIQGRGFRTLDEGERVEFEIMEEPKGLRACNVVRFNAPVVSEPQLRERGAERPAPAPSAEPPRGYGGDPVPAGPRGEWFAPPAEREPRRGRDERGTRRRDADDGEGRGRRGFRDDW